MQEASQNIQAVSQDTAHAVAVIKNATELQDRSVVQLDEMSRNLMGMLSSQIEQLQGVSGNFEQLQHVLTSGVEAFSQQLPRSVDQTLVQFDAAMGNGVARLGSSVERLREAMDDLNEQLETMLDPKRRR